MKHLFLLFLYLGLMGCQKKLDLKPSSSIVLPKTTPELESLLDNSNIINKMPALAQVSADEYFIPTQQDWQALFGATVKNATIWEKDVYAGESKIQDWTLAYTQIFYANSVLDLLSRQDLNDDPDKQRIKGWASFIRAYAFYALVSVFSKAYDSSTANTDLGLPLKINPGVDEVVPRSTVKQTYDQIIKDALFAAELLNTDIVPNKKNRPSKVAAFALLSRVFLSMRQYDQAEIYADKALGIYARLTDFNNFVPSTSVFNFNSEEVIYFSQQNNSYPGVSYAGRTSYGIDATLYALYSPSDLRLTYYFQRNALGNNNIRPINSPLGVPFTGLATDELYLIKAECLARRDRNEEALAQLNQLVKTRMVTDLFVPLTAGTSAETLALILNERRRALIWRGIRWTDLKRLNLEGRNIRISRKIGDQIYSLEPNSSRYVLPIPDDEIALSGIQQNIR